MKFGSVCSGIESASVAWSGLPLEAAFLSEIDNFPRAVLSHHYPDVPLHGDFTTIGEGDYDPIELLVGGTPCQDFSVAGLRKGLSGERGNLTLEFLRLAQRLRPKWLVWENVPGVLSIDEGRAFGSFLGGVAELGYGFAYRVLDAQFFGVAQRRRRVFVVGYLGDWRPPAAVLFERESLRGDTAPSRQARQAVAALTANGVGTCGADDNQGQAGHLIASTGHTAHCLNAGGMGRQDYETETLITHSLRGEGFDASEDGTGRGIPLVTPILEAGARSNKVTPINTQMGLRGPDTSNSVREGIGIGEPGDPMFTLQAAHQHAVAVAFAQNTRDEVRMIGGDGQISGALAAETGMKQQTYVAMNLRGREGGAMPELDDLASLRAASGGSSRSYVASSAVRRLTPRECERLQGFPEIKNNVTIEVWPSENQKINADADDLSHSLQSNALYAAGRNSLPSAKSAENHLRASHRDIGKPVAINVQIDLERSDLHIHSPGSLNWNASGADQKRKSPLLIPTADFVHLVALMPQILGKEIAGGKAGLPHSTKNSTTHSYGRRPVNLYGQEIEQLAGDVDAFIAKVSHFTKSITSEAGRNFHSFDLFWKTWSCFVAVAIGGFIPEPIRSDSLYEINIETTAGYTFIPHRGRMAADGPRYKALGNSMAVPVMRWIGQRIIEVDGS